MTVNIEEDATYSPHIFGKTSTTSQLNFKVICSSTILKYLKMPPETPNAIYIFVYTNQHEFLTKREIYVHENIPKGVKWCVSDSCIGNAFQALIIVYH